MRTNPLLKGVVASHLPPEPTTDNLIDYFNSFGHEVSFKTNSVLEGVWITIWESYDGQEYAVGHISESTIEKCYEKFITGKYWRRSVEESFHNFKEHQDNLEKFNQFKENQNLTEL